MGQLVDKVSAEDSFPLNFASEVLDNGKSPNSLKYTNDTPENSLVTNNNLQVSSSRLNCLSESLAKTEKSLVYWQEKHKLSCMDTRSGVGIL